MDGLSGFVQHNVQLQQKYATEEAIKTYVEMEKRRCDPDECTLEAVLSVYSVAGLVNECEEHFEEIKASGILPSVMCYCMMLAVYAKTDRSAFTQLYNKFFLSFV